MELLAAFSATKQGDTELQARRLGKLATSGRIIACDPLASSSKPFAVSFPRGCFDVELLLAKRMKNTRVALARVIFSDVTPTRFSLALREGEDERALGPGQRFGYGVDAGMGSFLEAGYEDLIGDDILEELEKNESTTWTWALRAPDGDGHRVVMFSSGYGDGVYSSYVGFDAKGSPVELVTDFRCLDLELPEVADDPDFRVTLARELWSKVQNLLPGMATGKTYGQAYELGQEIVASPEDAAPLIEAMWAGLEAASDSPVRDFHRFLIKRTLASQRALEKSIPHLDFDSPETVEQLSAVRELPAAIRNALWDRFDTMHPKLWAWFLDLVVRDPEGREDPRFIEGLRRGLDAPSTCERALGILSNQARLRAESLDDDLRESVADLATDGPTARARTTALQILSELGTFPYVLLQDPDPHRRFEVASALARKRINQDRSDPVLIELSRSDALTDEERLDAATHIWDKTAKIDALVHLGLSGHPYAAGQIRYVGGEAAVAGLERLAGELEDPKLRKEAERWLKRTKELLAGS